MSSELLGSAQNVLKGNLGGAWDITNGYQDAYTDLGIARRFGGAAAAYSLRDIGAMNGPVVRVRRNNDSTEEDFSANQVQAGVLEDFCDNVLTVGTAVNGTGAVDNYTVTNPTTTGFSADNSAGGVGSAGFPYTFKDGDVMTITYTVTNFSSTSGLSPAIRGVTATNVVTQVAGGGTTFTANGTYTDTLTATADGTHLMFADGNTGSYTISNFEVLSHKTDGFVETWYDQSGNGNDATQGTAANQPAIVQSGGLNPDGIKFDGTNDDLKTATSIGTYQSSNGHGGFAVYKKDTVSTSDTFNDTNPMHLYQIGNNLNTTTIAMRILGGKLYSVQADTNGDGSGFIDNIATNHSIGTNKTLSSIVGANQMKIFNNGVEPATSSESGASFNSTSNTFIRIGSQTSTNRFFDGSIEEVIIYTSDKTSDRSEIENDINYHYNIY